MSEKNQAATLTFSIKAGIMKIFMVNVYNFSL